MVAEPNPGVLDFQDAVCGPVTYDLVSLLRDAYIAWDEERQIDWAVRYWERARKAGLPVGDDFGAFWRDFEWMGVQRQLKVLGIFARLAHRDGKRGYLDDMPRVMAYLRGACERYRALHPLLALIDELDGPRRASRRTRTAHEARRDDPGGGPRRADAPADRCDAEAAARSRAASRSSSGRSKRSRGRAAPTS